MKVWSGSAWAEKPAKVWSGSAWVAKPVKVWTGTAWKVVPPAGAAGPTSKLVLSYTPGTDRNDFSGQVGVRLGIGAASIPVTFMGARRHSAAQVGNHTVRLYEWFANSLERTATVDMSSVAVGSYAWGPVAPYTLLAGGYYGLLMDVVASDGKLWCNPGPATFAASITNVYDIYRVGAGPMQTGGANSMFNGLDLGW